MKKGVLFLLLFLLFLIPFAIAQDEIIKTIDDKAYDCLKDRFEDTNCNGLSGEAKIFALLTLGECKDEVMEDSNFKSDIKYTSQAILALNKVGADTSEAVEWLWEQNMTPTDVIWYLQIDSSQETQCTITYDDMDHTINIGADKKIDSNAGGCLSRAVGNYWLQINPTCYGEEFEISCKEDFLTTLLFKRKADNIIHVSSESTSSQGEGTTIEKIEFLCLKKTNACDYEGTLWASLVLDYIGTEEDLSPVLFYLTTLNTVYPKLIPESFLYSLTGENEYENKLIQGQSPDGFWRISDNKYYDTALALLAIPSGSTSWEKAISWLEEEQMDTGCWNSNNFLDTAFILYSAWPRGVGGIDVSTGENCEDVGYFCMSGINCEGQILDSYDCEGFDKCCSQEQLLESCADLNGEICNTNQKCEGGVGENTFDLEYGQTCCIGGACEEKAIIQEEYTCALSGGICRIEGCGDGEESSYETCEFGDTCCIESTKEASYLWVWILIFLILIALVAIGIVKRDKLRELWFRLKSKLKKSPPAQSTGKPIPSMRTPQRMTPRRRPLMRRPSRIARPSAKAPGEINDVLKKLKDMGK